MAADEFSGLSLPPTSGIPYAGEKSGLIAPASIRGSGAFLHGLGQCVRPLAENSRRTGIRPIEPLHFNGQF